MNYARVGIVRSKEVVLDSRSSSTVPTSWETWGDKKLSEMIAGS